MTTGRGLSPCEEHVVLRSCHVEALAEEWGDLTEDPFWQPQAVVVLSVEMAQEILATHFASEERPAWFETLDDLTRDADDLRIRQSAPASPSSGDAS